MTANSDTTRATTAQACCRRHCHLPGAEGACGPFTEEDLRRIGGMAREGEQVAVEATPGPWGVDGGPAAHPVIVRSRGGGGFRVADVYSWKSDRDAPFIAAARTGWPALAAALAAVLEQLAEVTRERDDGLREIERLADQDVDGCHATLTAAGIAAGALAERVEDLVEERERAIAQRDAQHREVNQAVAERDRLIDRIGDLAAHVGCEREFTNLHDHASCITDAYDAAVARAAAAEQLVAGLERDVAKLNAEGVEAGVRARAAGRKAEQAFRDVAACHERERVMQAQLSTVSTHEAGVWFWQGDGHDHPDSLACPVVMSADTLRTLLANRAAAAARAQIAAAALSGLRAAVRPIVAARLLHDDECPHRVCLDQGDCGASHEGCERPAEPCSCLVGLIENLRRTAERTTGDGS